MKDKFLDKLEAIKDGEKEPEKKLKSLNLKNKDETSVPLT